MTSIRTRPRDSDGSSRQERREFPPGVTARTRLLLRLQTRAPANTRRRFARALMRTGVLVTGDVVAFGATRAAYRLLRDTEVLGSGVAARVATHLPAGYLNGWQYAASLVLGLMLAGSYRAGRDQRRDPSRIFFGVLLATALNLWLPMWEQGAGVVALQFLITAASVFVATWLDRMTIESIVGRWRVHAPVAARTILVGTRAEYASVLRHLSLGQRHDLRMVGFVDILSRRVPGSLGTMAEVPQILAREHVEALVVSDRLDHESFAQVAESALAARCQLLGLPERFRVGGLEPSLQWHGEQALVLLTPPGLHAQQIVLKRGLDIVLGSIGLLLAAPLLLVVTVAVALDSGWPVLFGQARLGLNGRLFNCLKFRSMHPEAERHLQDDAQLHSEYVANGFKLDPDRDPRLTRVGRFIRRWSLDELPQLINVVRGDMSLVGPRPIVPDELTHYGEDAALFLSLKPGLTGAWAVQGRSAVGYPDRVDLELGYARAWSLWIDLGILLRTGPAVLGRRGAF